MNSHSWLLRRLLNSQVGNLTRNRPLLIRGLRRFLRCHRGVILGSVWMVGNPELGRKSPGIYDSSSVLRTNRQPARLGSRLPNRRPRLVKQSGRFVNAKPHELSWNHPNVRLQIAPLMRQLRRAAAVALIRAGNRVGSTPSQSVPKPVLSSGSIVKTICPW